jgi:glyceraldehyde-3-phosphate dehydrogenase/erythrose-4-phosphate dehydrogenase
MLPWTRHRVYVSGIITYMTVLELINKSAWYDNEMGYTNTLVEHVEKVGKLV